MTQNSFELVLISSEDHRSDEAAIVSNFFEMGLRAFHLRKPKCDESEITNFLRDLPGEFHSYVVLHSHFHLVDRFGVKGIHLGEANKKLVNECHRYKIISASFHSLRDLEENDFRYEYIFLSPIFDSISKPGYRSGFDIKTLTEELDYAKKQNRSLPKIIALGGVNENNIKLIKDAGFSGAAVLGAIWQKDDPVNAFLKISSIVRSL